MVPIHPNVSSDNLLTLFPQTVPQNRSDEQKGANSLSARQALNASAVFRRFGTPRRGKFDRLEIASFCGEARFSLLFWMIPFRFGGFFMHAI